MANIENFDITKLKKNKFYLGKKLIKNEIVDNYIDIDKLQRVAIVGTSGGGKSNITNLILLNLLFNIKSIESIIFADFKGGIEAQPLLTVANQFNLNIIICTNFNELHEELIKIDKINKILMDFNKKNELKNYNGKFNYILFDEFAQVGLAKPTTKESKEQLQQILSIYSSLHATGRSQKIYCITITQSFLQNASGLPSDVKTNLSTKIMFKTDNKESIQSVFSADILESNNLDPKNLDMGQFIMQNDDQIYKCKAVLVPDNIKPEFIKVLNYNKQNKTNKPKKYNFTYNFFEQLQYKLWFIKFGKATTKFYVVKKYKNLPSKITENILVDMYLPKNWSFTNIITNIISFILNTVFVTALFISVIYIYSYFKN